MNENVVNIAMFLLSEIVYMDSILNTKIKFINKDVKISNLLLFLMVVLFVINAVISSTAFMYITVLYTYLLLIIMPQNYSMAMVLFLLPNAGYFDDLGFTYLFNFSIALFFIKIFVSNLINNKLVINTEFIIAVFLLLYASIDEWCSAITSAIAVEREKCVGVVADSGYDISEESKKLEQLYLELSIK